MRLLLILRLAFLIGCAAAFLVIGALLLVHGVRYSQLLPAIGAPLCLVASFWFTQKIFRP